VREITGATSEIVHTPAAAVYGPNFQEPRRRVPDVTLAREVLGFVARTSLEEGLRLTLNWFRGTGAEPVPARSNNGLE
jgi:nucleoside-diphosphate-sugar epimerase